MPEIDARTLEQQPAWDDTAMSGTARRVTDPLVLGKEVKEVSYQLPWTNGTAVDGDFGLEVSNDGTTYTVLTASTHYQRIGPAVSSNSSTVMLEATIRARYVRAFYLNASGTGTLGSPVAHVKRSG